MSAATESPIVGSTVNTTTEHPATTSVAPPVEESKGTEQLTTEINKDVNPSEPPTASEAAATTTSAEEPSKEHKVSKKETQITATPITSGTLGYKAPGIMRFVQIIFSSFDQWG